MSYNSAYSRSINKSRGKASGLDEPEFLDQKRNVYGQYRHAPKYEAPDDKFSTGASQSPRRPYIVPPTEQPTAPIVLEACEYCGRKFNPGKLASYAPPLYFVSFLDYFLRLTFCFVANSVATKTCENLS